MTAPMGDQLSPSTMNSLVCRRFCSACSTVSTRTTLIMLVVSVPVLSEQMTVVQPSVSTLGRERTMAFLRAIFMVPSARHVVTTAGRPSGMAATASATAILK